MLRKQNRYALRNSPSNSAQPSYQSTCASPPHVYDCGTKVSSPSNPIAAFRWRTYWRTVDSAAVTSGISRRSRVQIRCAVCRCFLGALRSASKAASINGIAAASLGRSRSGIFRSGGIALASALRTSRRCTPSFRATARIVPPPCSYSRRICSYSSTFALLFSKIASPSGLENPKQYTRFMFYRWGQIRASKGANSEYRNHPKSRNGDVDGRAHRGDLNLDHGFSELLDPARAHCAAVAYERSRLAVPLRIDPVDRILEHC